MGSRNPCKVRLLSILQFFYIYIMSETYHSKTYTDIFRRRPFWWRTSRYRFIYSSNFYHGTRSDPLAPVQSLSLSVKISAQTESLLLENKSWFAQSMQTS